MTSFQTTTQSKRIAGKVGKYLNIALAASVFAVAGAAPAFAASRQSTYSNSLFANDVDTGSIPISAKRAAAVHDCSVAASKYNFSTWQETQILSYDECMANHGELP